MPDQSIRSHIAALLQQGELTRFTKEVDPDESLSAVSWQSFARQGKACLFETIKGHPGWRVVSQVVADRRKWAAALGVPEGEVVTTLNERIARSLDPVMVPRERAPVKEVVKLGKDVDLRKLPAMWTSEADPGRYIASGMCIIKDPHTGIRNVSFHRAQIVGPDRTGYLICPRQALKIYQMYGELNRPMEAAMVIGAHPLMVFCAGFVAPYGQDEFGLAGGLLGEAVRMVKCETIDMEVPADAEIVLEGELLPGEMTPEGPFGEVTGGYAQEGSTPMFRVKAITHRRDPIFYAMQCGLPPSDAHSIVCTTIEMKLWQHLRGVAGGLDLLDVRCIAGMSPMMVVLKLRQKFPGQARAALLAAVSSPYLHPKIAVAVDEDVDISDMAQIYWAMTNRVRRTDQVQKVNRARVFALDNASLIEEGMSAMYRVGTKVLIDTTEDPATPQATWARYQPAAASDRAAIAARLGVDVERVLETLAQRRRSGSDAPAVDRSLATEVAVYEHLRQVEGGLDVLDVRCFPETGHRLVVVKLRPRVQGQSKTACMAALSSPDIGPKLVIAVDDDIDATDLREVSWSFASRLHAEHDIALIEGLPEPSGNGVVAAFKWFVDSTMPPLTQKVKRADFTRATPKNLAKVKLQDFLPEGAW
jgi:2,5-furandicarboxylate decarboxylase 1